MTHPLMSRLTKEIGWPSLPLIGDVTGFIGRQGAQIGTIPKARAVPVVNKALQVQAVGYRMEGGRPLGILNSPWFMNLLRLPDTADHWGALTPGAKEIIGLPSGDCEFRHNTRKQTGGYKACSLFSSMSDFETQAQAVDLARAVWIALFNEENRADSDRFTDIRAAREAQLAAPEQTQANFTPQRRRIISANMADD